MTIQDNAASPSREKPDRLAAIAERAEKATAGPWHAREHPPVGAGLHDCWSVWAMGPGGLRITDVAWLKDNYGGNETADADFIAHAREDIPYLLQQVRALTEAVERASQETAELDKTLIRVSGEKAALRAQVAKMQEAATSAPGTAEVATLLGDDELKAIAERQLSWVDWKTHPQRGELLIDRDIPRLLAHIGAMTADRDMWQGFCADLGCGNVKPAQIAALTPGGRDAAIPEGWQVVPKVADANMIEAGMTMLPDHLQVADAVFEMMCGAAPTPPVAPGRDAAIEAVEKLAEKWAAAAVREYISGKLTDRNAARGPKQEAEAAFRTALRALKQPAAGGEDQK